MFQSINPSNVSFQADLVKKYSKEEHETYTKDIAPRYLKGADDNFAWAETKLKELPDDDEVRVTLNKAIEPPGRYKRSLSEALGYVLQYVPGKESQDAGRKPAEKKVTFEQLVRYSTMRLGPVADFIDDVAKRK